MPKIFITGGTGSVGKEIITNQNSEFFKDCEFVLFSRDEWKHSVVRSMGLKNVKTIVGDIRDENAVLKAMDGCDFVIHAAALKRIEICQENPIEAVTNNVLGTENVCKVAKSIGVEKLVALSTDKACKPINVYGIVSRDIWGGQTVSGNIP